MNHEMFSSQLENRISASDKHDNPQHVFYHSSVYRFKDIENIIQLAHRMNLPFFDTKLISFNNQYYLVVQYPETRWVRDKGWIESLILEYGERGHTSIYRLQEYGKVILSENAISTIKDYFKVYS